MASFLGDLTPAARFSADEDGLFVLGTGGMHLSILLPKDQQAKNETVIRIEPRSHETVLLSKSKFEVPHGYNQRTVLTKLSHILLDLSTSGSSPKVGIVFPNIDMILNDIQEDDSDRTNAYHKFRELFSNALWRAHNIATSHSLTYELWANPSQFSHFLTGGEIARFDHAFGTALEESCQELQINIDPNDIQFRVFAIFPYGFKKAVWPQSGLAEQNPDGKKLPFRSRLHRSCVHNTFHICLDRRISSDCREFVQSKLSRLDINLIDYISIAIGIECSVENHVVYAKKGFLISQDAMMPGQVRETGRPEFAQRSSTGRNTSLKSLLYPVIYCRDACNMSTKGPLFMHERALTSQACSILRTDVYNTMAHAATKLKRFPMRATTAEKKLTEGYQLNENHKVELDEQFTVLKSIIDSTAEGGESAALRSETIVEFNIQKIR